MNYSSIVSCNIYYNTLFNCYTIVNVQNGTLSYITAGDSKLFWVEYNSSWEIISYSNYDGSNIQTLITKNYNQAIKDNTFNFNGGSNCPTQNRAFCEEYYHPLFDFSGLFNTIRIGIIVFVCVVIVCCVIIVYLNRRDKDAYSRVEILLATVANEIELN